MAQNLLVNLDAKDAILKLIEKLMTIGANLTFDLFDYEYFQHIGLNLFLIL
mgnify:CR=1 FL=1